MDTASRSHQGVPLGVARLGLCLALALAPLANSVGLAQTTAPTAPGDTRATLEPTELEAHGFASSLLTVTDLGRYAITVKSPQGTALRGVDRMLGPGAWQGIVGESDGRLDVLLDTGELKIDARSDDKGSGSLELAVRPFVERNRNDDHTSLPVLRRLEPVETSLGDFEQRSYWLQLGQQQQVRLEAAGRHLHDMRLWREGTWLVDAAPQCEQVQPVVGRPLLLCSLAATLGAGNYLLSAYGGVSQPWADDDGSMPLHLRWGIPSLPGNARSSFVASPFGVDRFLVPSEVDVFHLELPEALPSQLEVALLDPDAPFEHGGAAAEITKESRTPVAEVLQAGQDKRQKRVTVRTAPGQSYILQHFVSVSGAVQRLHHPNGRYWVSTLHTGDAGDSVDVTALLTRSRSDRIQEDVYLDQVVQIDALHKWSRRMNLLAPLSLFVDVRTTERYQILSNGTEARFRFEPFLVSRPQRYEPPPFRPGGESWDLNAGYYVLTAQPVARGILDIAVQREPRTTDARGDFTGIPAPPMPRVQFPRVEIDPGHYYTLHWNVQPGVRTGLVIRKWPLDLSDALPVWLASKQRLELDTVARRPSHLVIRYDAESADADATDALAIQLDGGPVSDGTTVTPGDHRLVLENRGEELLELNLALAPIERPELTPLPAADQTPPPSFPVLSSREPAAFDLDRGAIETFQVEVERPALYEIESHGLLDTEGNLRSRTLPSFDRQKSGGSGRNFIIQQYLERGAFSLSVRTLGKSRGHSTLTLHATELLDGGSLSSGIPARASVPAGEAVAYRFTIGERGRYRLRSLGLGRSFRARLEDQDGWPVEPTNVPADFDRIFEPGSYRLVLLPEATDSRRLTLLEPVPDPIRYQGHGPHPLPLEQSIEHLWLEPEESSAGGDAGDDAAREPDVFTFTLNGDSQVHVALSDEMQGTIYRAASDGQRERAASNSGVFVPPERGFTGPLAAGSYRFEIRCSRRNNRVRYHVGVWPEELLVGQRREVAVPGAVELSIGREQLVEISTFGAIDLAAQLFDHDGTLLRSADDRTDDWNVQLSERLHTGHYHLALDSVAGDNGEVTVALRAPQEQPTAPLTLPATLSDSVGGAVRVQPLAVAPGTALLVAELRSEESHGLSFEGQVDGVWKSLATVEGHRARLALPLPVGTVSETPLRLRLWSLDQRNNPVQVRVVGIERSAFAVSEQALARGEPARAIEGLEASALAPTLERAGVLRLQSASPSLLACTLPLRPCAPPSDGLVVAPHAELWLLQDLGASEALSGNRVLLGDGEALSLEIPEGEVAVVDVGEPTRRGSADGPWIAHLAMPGGHPGLSLVPLPTRRTAALDLTPHGAGMAVDDSEALAVSLQRGPLLALLWNAGDASRMPVRLSLERAAALERQASPCRRGRSLDWGTHTGALAPQRSFTCRLPSGRKEVTLALDRQAIAVLSSRRSAAGASPPSVHWRGGERTGMERLTTEHDTLTVIARGDAEPSHGTEPNTAQFAVDLLPVADDAVSTLRPGALETIATARRGTLRLRVAPASLEPQQPSSLRSFTVRVGGAAEQALWVGDSGAVRQGTKIDAGGPGTLLVEHRPGIVLAWLDSPGSSPWWDGTGESRPLHVDPPARVELSGPSTVLVVESSTPTLLHLEAPVPATTAVRLASGLERFGDHARGVDLYVPLLPGRTSVALRALGEGAELAGAARLSTTAVTELGEGLAPEVLLAPGGARLFSFTLPEAGAVGVGVRADSAAVAAEILGADGNALVPGAEGPREGTDVGSPDGFSVQMLDLQPGTYYLLLRAGDTHRAVRARPALVGLERPGHGPPPEVLRHYLEQAAASNGQEDAP